MNAIVSDPHTAIDLIRQHVADADIVREWVRSHRSDRTRDAYERGASAFLASVGTPMRSITATQLQDYAEGLAGADATRARQINLVRSLFAYAHRAGYLQVNPSVCMSVPTVRSAIVERIMTESDIHKLVAAAEPNARNHTLLRLAYIAGLRISELVGLRWRDCIDRDGLGQITVLGKGAKVRTILLPAPIWQALVALRRDAANDAPVFKSREGGHLDASQVHRIVKDAAHRAGLPEAVSCHWLRHAHASHSLDRGAPIHVVQTTLGHANVATTSIYIHARPTDSSALHLAV